MSKELDLVLNVFKITSVTSDIYYRVCFSRVVTCINFHSGGQKSVLQIVHFAKYRTFR